MGNKLPLLQADWLVGGGEMGNVIRSMDWSRTPLGPRESWPQSLRTTVNLCLSSNFPIAMIWGPQCVQLYNDGYWPNCGTKHPQSMGQDFRECWASAWPVIGDVFEQALSGQAAFIQNQRMFLDRHGYLEETFFTFSFSPIRDESGQVGGLFHPITELTQQSLMERRLQALRVLADNTADAKTVDQAIAAATEVFADCALDLPFALIYQFDRDMKEARLVSTTGLAAGTLASPTSVVLDAPDTEGWPLAHVAQSRHTVQVSDLDQRFGPFFCGPYPEPLQIALAMPLTLSASDHVFGVLIAGVSTRRALDPSYEAFYDLLRDALAAALSRARNQELERKRVEELAELDRAKTDFFSNVSHEFRTPLTLLLGPLEEGLKDPVSSPELTRQRLDLAHRNALRLLKLVNSLLDFARIEVGRTQASYAPVDLAIFTSQLASMFRSVIESAGLEFVVDCAPLPEPVYVDCDMWEKIVLNLLSNAFKFTFAGSIAVRLQWQSGAAVLTVSDTGIGVPPEHVPLLFERFHRVPNARSRTYEGSGIGLALAHELVKLHGGEVSVDSTLGKGTQFTVLIPGGTAHLSADMINTKPELASTAIDARAFVEEAQHWLPDTPVSSSSAVSTVAAPLSDEQDHGSRPRILFADDNADMRRYVTTLLAPHWEVDVAVDGMQALEIIRRAPPDLVLTDVMMPNLDGFGLLQAVRADKQTDRLPVIMLSARAGEEARVEGLHAGADDYLVKPFNAGELLARIRTHLEIAEIRQRANNQTRVEQAKRVEAEQVAEILRIGEERLRLAEDQLRIATEAAELGIWIWEIDSDKVSWKNDRLWEIFGLPKNSETINVAQFLSEVIHPDDAKPYQNALKHSVHSGERLYFAGQFFKAPNRELRWFEFTGLLQPAKDGAPRRMIGTAADITERKLAEEQLRRLASELSKANRRKTEFLATLAHELRNPLAPIRTGLDLMRVAPDNLAVVGRAQDMMDRQLTQMVRLIDDLMDISRINSGKIELKKERVELKAIVSNAIEAALPMIEAAQHELDVQLPGRPVWLDADTVRLTQVLTNLLTNASKYTPHCGRIVVSAQRKSKGIAISVSDTGIGIPPESIPDLFSMFSQVSKNMERAQGGLGIGLSLVKSLVEMHGGSVSVASEGEGKGSAFTIELPTLEGTASPSRPQPSEEAIGKPATQLKVLIADDNIDAARMLLTLLEIGGHQVEIVHDGHAALEKANQTIFDLIILDIGMPGLTGYEVARELRKMPGMEKTVLARLLAGAPKRIAIAREKLDSILI